MVTNSKKISFLFWLYFCKCGNGLLNLGNTTNGAQQDRVVGSVAQISTILAANFEQLMLCNKQKTPNILKCNSPVKKIEQDAQKGCTVTTMRGEYFCSKYVVVTCPPPEAAKLEFSVRVVVVVLITTTFYNFLNKNSLLYLLKKITC